MHSEEARKAAQETEEKPAEFFQGLIRNIEAHVVFDGQLPKYLRLAGIWYGFENNSTTIHLMNDESAATMEYQYQNIVNGGIDKSKTN